MSETNVCYEKFKVLADGRIDGEYGINYTSINTFKEDIRCREICGEIGMKVCIILQTFENIKKEKEKEQLELKTISHSDHAGNGEDLEKKGFDIKKIKPEKKGTNRGSTRRKKQTKKSKGNKSSIENKGLGTENDNETVEAKEKKRNGKGKGKFNPAYLNGGRKLRISRVIN